MDRKTLEQYPYILAEIEKIDKQIAALSNQPISTDTVMGSSDDYPYVLHPVSIAGLPNTEKICLLHQKRSDYMAQARQIEDFVSHLPNLRIRNIVEMKAFKKMRWEDIASEVTRITGKDTTSNSVKSYYKRLFKKL